MNGRVISPNKSYFYFCREINPFPFLHLYCTSIQDFFLFSSSNKVFSIPEVWFVISIFHLAFYLNLLLFITYLICAMFVLLLQSPQSIHSHLQLLWRALLLVYINRSCNLCFSYYNSLTRFHSVLFSCL